jgi:hypothetical protein
MDGSLNGDTDNKGTIGLYFDDVSQSYKIAGIVNRDEFNNLSLTPVGTCTTMTLKHYMFDADENGGTSIKEVNDTSLPGFTNLEFSNDEDLRVFCADIYSTSTDDNQYSVVSFVNNIADGYYSGSMMGQYNGKIDGYCSDKDEIPDIGKIEAGKNRTVNESEEVSADASDKTEEVQPAEVSSASAVAADTEAVQPEAADIENTETIQPAAEQDVLQATVTDTEAAQPAAVEQEVLQPTAAEAEASQPEVSETENVQQAADNTEVSTESVDPVEITQVIQNTETDIEPAA